MVGGGEGRKSGSFDRGILGESEVESWLDRLRLLESFSPVDMYNMSFDSFDSAEPENHLRHELFLVRRSICLLGVVDVKPLGDLGVAVVGGSDFGDRGDIVKQ